MKRFSVFYISFITSLALYAGPKAQAVGTSTPSTQAKDTQDASDAVMIKEQEEFATDEGYNKALDGIIVEAVENYPNPKNSELGISLGFLPFKPYYAGFSLNGDYVYIFSKSISWEVLNLAYAFTVASDLTTQLADKYKVAPQQIERVQFLVSTNFIYTFTYGKAIFLSSFIRYFRSSFVGGVGLVNTTLYSKFGVNVGLRLDAQINDTLSLKLEFRDMIALTNNVDSFAAFNLGTAVQF